MAANRTDKNNKYSDLAEQFSAVTGASKQVGLRLLEVCNGNLELAVTMQLEGTVDMSELDAGNNRAGPSTASAASIPAEDEVRAPIPAKFDILVEDSPPYGPRPRGRGGRGSVFDRFRDFRAETKQQEEMLRTGFLSGAPKSSKRKTLEDLFRPPLDLMHSGSFHSARDAGQKSGKWLMVNIQNAQEFSCQKLNRDLWSDATVKSIVQESFVFWQVYHDSNEGQRYLQFYQVTQFPYVAIVDPRTGELLSSWHNLDTMAFCDLVMEFLIQHPCFDAATGFSPPAKKIKTENILDQDEETQLKMAIKASLSEEPNSKPKKEVIDLSEESEDSQIKAALAASFAENSSESSGRTNPSKSSRKLSNTIDLTKEDSVQELSDEESEGNIISSDDGFSFSDEETVIENGKSLGKTISINSSVAEIDVTDQGSSQDEKVSAKKNDDSTSQGTVDVSEDSYSSEQSCLEDEAHIVLRLPDGKRKQVTLNSQAPLKDLINIVTKEGFSADKYELVTNFPFRRLALLDENTTLSAAKLVPRETVIVHEK